MFGVMKDVKVFHADDVDSAKRYAQADYEERIICPSCGKECLATVEASIPFNVHVHDCEHCGYTIMESEWERVERKDRLPQTVWRCVNSSCAIKDACLRWTDRDNGKLFGIFDHGRCRSFIAEIRCERIACPACGGECLATVPVPSGVRIHYCEHCGRVILEGEWQLVENIEQLE